MENRLKGILVGVYPATGLGDLVQYVTAVLTLLNNVKDVHLDVSIPNYILARKYVSRIMNCRNVMLIRGLFECSLKGEGVWVRSFKGIRSRNLLDCIRRMFVSSNVFLEYGVPVLSKAMNNAYDFGCIGGHSVDDNAVKSSGIVSATTYYRGARSIVKGSLVLFPCSITNTINLIHLKKVKLFKEALQKFDLVCVRGFYSRKTLEKFIDSSRIIISPDTTFAIRTLFRDLYVNFNKGHKDKYRVTLVLRRDYFINFNQISKYSVYLKTLLHLVEMLYTRYDIETILLIHEIFEDSKAVKDFIKLLKRNKHRDSINVIIPKDLFEDMRWLMSSDVVISSRLHAGLIPLSMGIPTFFILPRNDIRILDVFSLLRLDLNFFVIDIFSPAEINGLSKKVIDVVEDISKYKSTIEHAVNRTEKLVFLPAKILVNLIYQQC